mmetsp:Transcript_23302/g.66329  ORF Transcript_23302/g.66329 Transcript_23302/m.66329 type:complete len:403 (+) Transcript_23302:97-1305(+)
MASSLRVLATALAAAAAAASPDACPGRTCADAEAASLLQARLVADIGDAGPWAKQRGGVRDPEDDEKAFMVGCANSFAPVAGGSDLDLDVFGRVTVKAFKGPNSPNSGTQLFVDLLDVDPACSMGPGNDPASCGVRIHSGNCSALGQPLYDASARAMDPWGCVSYTSVEYRTEVSTTTTTSVEPVLAQRRAAAVSESGYVTFKTKSVMSVYTGESPESIKGAVVAIYDHAGKVMACSPISTEKDHRLPASAATTFRPLKAEHWVKQSSAVSGMVWGQVLIFERMGKTLASTGQLLTWDLEEVDNECAKGPKADVANSCGIHVEDGSCSSLPTSGDIWDSSVVERNPWSCVGYTSLWTKRTPKAAGRSITAYAGMGTQEMIGQVVIVYSSLGLPMACADILFE